MPRSHGQDGSHTSSPHKGSLSRYDSVPNLPRTQSIAEVRDLIKEHVNLSLSSYEHARKSDEELKAMKKPLRRFYEQQNELVRHTHHVTAFFGFALTVACATKAGLLCRGRVSSLAVPSQEARAKHKPH